MHILVICTCMYIHSYTYTCNCTYTGVHTYVPIDSRCSCVDIHVYQRMCISTRIGRPTVSTSKWHAQHAFVLCSTAHTRKCIHSCTHLLIWCMCACMCVRVHILIYIHAHMHTYTCIFTYTRTQIHIHMTYACSTYNESDVFLSVNFCTCMYAFMCACAWRMHACNACILHVYVYVCMWICMYARTHTSGCTLDE